jgi:hypothetical protein
MQSFSLSSSWTGFRLALKGENMRPAVKLTLQLALLLLWTSQVFSQNSRDLAAIKNYITKQEAAEHQSADEDYGKVVMGDLNHDGIPDAAVLYTMEDLNGTNNYVQYLAVFTRNNGRLVPVCREAVGGKQYRSIDLTSIRNNTMYFQTTDYAPQDPTCCPTMKGSTRYALNGKKLKEIRGK